VSLSWVACNAKDGRVLADLPDVSVGSVSVVLGSYTTTDATLPIPTAPADWVRATMPGGAFLVLLDDPGDGSAPVPVWGGMITRRRRTLGDVAPLSLATIEAYLDRRFVRDREFAGVSQTQIVKSLVEEFVTGFPIRVEASSSAISRDREYKDSDDKSVLAALSELFGVADGPEWTIGWEHQADPERYTPVLYVADRLGSGVPAGLGPAATFEAPGPVVEAELVEDFGAGKGATDVMATSTASQDVRPQSPHQVGASERPPFEHRFTPSTSISEISTLTAHAQAALGQMLDGAQALTLSAVVQDAPRLGRDWFIGDDIGYRLGDAWLTREGLYPDDGVFPGTKTFPVAPKDVAHRTVPAFPEGLSGTARCIGWSMDLSDVPVVTPILATEEV
jgi:hypothetical protein